VASGLLLGVFSGTPSGVLGEGILARLRAGVNSSSGVISRSESVSGNVNSPSGVFEFDSF